MVIGCWGRGGRHATMYLSLSVEYHGISIVWASDSDETVGGCPCRRSDGAFRFPHLHQLCTPKRFPNEHDTERDRTR